MKNLSTNNKNKKIIKNIILYDFLLVQGGAESLTLTLCEASPALDLGVAFIDKSAFPFCVLDEKRIKLFSTITKMLGWQSVKACLAFERKSNMIVDYDKVIFSGSNAPLAVKSRIKGGNVLYCHTPPRYMYDLKDYYLSQLPVWKQFLLKGLTSYLQPKYEKSIQKMDLVIANSKNVQARLKKHLNQESVVIYPPCHIEQYQWGSQGDYYLSTARVEPFKRIQLIVQAFMSMPNKKLIVASGGSDLERLKLLAKDYKNISFTGWCEKETLIDLVNNCIATIYLPIDEDFGISPVESMAAGKPVIGINEGGVKETVIDNITGTLCPSEPSVDDVIVAINLITPLRSLQMKDDCVQQSKQFSADIFISKMQRLLDCDNQYLVSAANTLGVK
jgi:glycosyltransferase involved in cell wall biosynthesis